VCASDGGGGGGGGVLASSSLSLNVISRIAKCPPRAAFHQPTYRRASAPRGLVIRSNSQIRKSRCDDVDAGRLHIETWRESRKYRRIASDELQIGFKSRDERCGLYSQK